LSWGELSEKRRFLYNPSNTELEAIRKLDLALWALHGFPRRIVEAGGFVKSLSPKETPHDGMNND
jgi:hypothetical protein